MLGDAEVRCPEAAAREPAASAITGRLGFLPEAATQLECKTSAFLCPLHIEGRGSDPDVRMPCASR